MEIVAICIPLILLRLLQLLSYAPLLYGFEFAQFGSLAWGVTQGYIEPAANLPEFLSRYEYGSFSQGTLVPSLGAALLARLGFGATIWNLHATAIGCELLAVAALMRLLQKLQTPVVFRWLSVAAWVLGSGFAVAWQLMPYGNHAAFLMIPLALAGALVRPGVGGPATPGASDEGPSRIRCVWESWIYPIVLVLLAFVLYRLNLAACLAYGVALLLMPAGASRLRPVLVLTCGLGLAVLLLFWLNVEPRAGVSLAPRFAPSWEVLPYVPGRLLSRLPAPGQQLHWNVATRIILLFGIALAIGRAWAGGGGGRVALFATCWALFSLGAPLISTGLGPEYLLPGAYALMLCWISALLPGAPPAFRRIGCGGLVVLLLSGLVDNGAMIRPAGFEQSLNYDGAELWRRFNVINLDVDELPAYQALADANFARSWIGFASNTEPQRCPIQPARTLGPMPDPTRDRCQGWPAGALGRAILDAQSKSPPPDLEAIGMGAFVVCQRSMVRVEAAIEGLNPEDTGHVLAGARMARRLVEMQSHGGDGPGSGAPWHRVGR